VNVPGIVDRLALVPDAVVAVDGTTGEILIRRQGPAATARSEPVAGVAPSRTPPAIGETAPVHIFVTGLIGVGALLSMVTTLTEKLGSVRGRTRLHTRAEPLAHRISAAILRGFDAVNDSPVGVRSRRWYATVAVLLLSVAAATGARSAVGYSQSDPQSSQAVLAWAAATTTTLTLAAGAVLLTSAALRWPAVSPLVRRLELVPASPQWRITEWLGPRRAGVVAACSGITALIGLLIATRFAPLATFDRWLYDTIDAGQAADRYSPDWMNALGKPIVVIPLAVVLAVMAWHCRTLAVLAPTAIVGTGVTVFVLTWLTMRDRPPLGAHAGEHNSFPGGHVAQQTLLFGLIPLVVGVVTDRRWARRFAAIASTLVLGVLLTDTVRTGGHWPSDQLAGVLIAVAVLVTVDACVRAPENHARCRHSCPLKGSADDRPRAKA
jgi:hypothetical protein